MEIIKGEDLKGMQFVKDEDGRLVIYEPKGRFIPKRGEKYWQIRTFGTICSKINYNDPGDRWCIRHNLLFRTKEECEDYKWYLEQLDKYSHEFGENDEGHYFFFNHRLNMLKTNFEYSCEIGDTHYFTKKSIAEFRETVGDERIKKYMFNV